MKKFILLLATIFMLFTADSFASIITKDTVYACTANILGSVNLRNYQTDIDNSKNSWKALNGAPLNNNQFVPLANAGTFKYLLTFVSTPLGGMPSIETDTLTVIINNKILKKISLDGPMQICKGDSVKVFFADSTLLTKPLIWANGDTAFYTFAKDDADVLPMLQMEDQKLCISLVRDFKIATFDCNSSIKDGKILTEDSAVICLPSLSVDLRKFQVNSDVNNNIWSSLDEPTLVDNHIFVTTTEGTYRFQLFFIEMILGNPNEYLDTLVLEVKSGCVTSVNSETDLNNSISVFPNPASDIVTVSNKNRFVTYNSILVKDVLGNTVKVININGFDSDLKIDLSSLAKGCYYLTSDNHIYLGKVIIE